MDSPSDMADDYERIDALGPGLCLKDMDGTFVYANETLRALFDLPDGSLYGKTDFHLFNDDQAKEVRQNDRRVLTTGESLVALETIFLSNGRRTDWLCEKFRIDSPMGPLVAVIAIQVTQLVSQLGPTAAIVQGKSHLLHLDHLRQYLVAIAAELTQSRFGT